MNMFLAALVAGMATTLWFFVDRQDLPYSGGGFAIAVAMYWRLKVWGWGAHVRRRRIQYQEALKVLGKPSLLAAKAHRRVSGILDRDSDGEQEHAEAQEARDNDEEDQHAEEKDESKMETLEVPLREPRVTSSMDKSADDSADTAAAAELLPGARFIGVTIGHRGGAGVHQPENTIAAFAHAHAHGATAVELDVRLTRDGKLIVFHDEEVSRLTYGKGWVDKLTFEEIRALKLRPNIPPPAHGTPTPSVPEEDRDNDESKAARGADGEFVQIPTLEEVLVFARVCSPRLLVMIELKDFPASKRLMRAVIETIRSCDAEGYVCVASFSPIDLYKFGKMARAHALCSPKHPEIPLNFLVADTPMADAVKHRLAAPGGKVPWLMTTRAMQAMGDGFLHYFGDSWGLWLLGAHIVSVQSRIMCLSLAEYYETQGIVTCSWTVNAKSTQQCFREEYGVTVITDNLK